MNFKQASEKLKTTDGILQMDLSNLYALFIQYRTDANQLNHDGKYLEEFILVIKEILNEKVINP
jgi:hypothetical protein